MFNRPQLKQGKLSLYILFLVASIAMMVSVKQCSVKTIPERSEQLAGGDTLNIAIEISPMGVMMQGDTLGGHYYNMINRIGKAMNCPMKFHAFTRLETALEGLKDNRYDIVVSDIPATADMKEHYIFVQPGEIDKQVLVQRRDSAGNIPFTTQFELANQSVTVPRNSPFISRLHNLAHEIGDTIKIVEDPQYSSEQLIILTALGEVPNVVVNAKVAQPLLKDYPQLDASLEISFNQFQGWAMAPRDSVLRDSIMHYISKL